MRMKSGLLSLVALLGAGCAHPQSDSHAVTDLLIENASLVDGTGAPARVADVRVRDDRIAEIGALDAQAGEQVVDAGGLTLAPGFIDTHSHHGGGLDAKPEALAALAQGITTIVVGQDGGSELPLSAYFEKRAAAPAAVNVASYSGHNTIREAVMGEDYKREASAAEVERMRALLDADMVAGALGLSTGLEYDPGIYSARGEVLTLAKEAARHGGRYISHIRSEDRTEWDAIEELIAIGREAKLPVQLSHAKLAMVDWWGQADRALDMLDRARAEGIDATIDVYPYPYWQSTLSVLWPERDFGSRETAEFILAHVVPADKLLITSFPPEPALNGKSVAEIAAIRKTDQVSALMALIREVTEADTGARVIATSMDEGDIARFIAWPHANISSDGAIDDRHPRGAGAFARALRVYVRETRLLALEAMIHKMTALSARHMGIVDRGTIQPGAYADLVLFDPATITDRSTVQDPTALSTGVAKVWVNGKLVLDDGRATGQRPGRVIRRSAR